VYLETAGDAEVIPGGRLRLQDRAVWLGPDGLAGLQLRLLSPLRGVTIRYTPCAMMLLEIAAPGGRLIYRYTDDMRHAGLEDGAAEELAGAGHR
jgi:hypothetical protein